MMKKYEYLLFRYGADILSSSGMELSKQFFQHGDTSVYEHSVSVALMCLAIAGFLHLRINEQALVRGALLHDYFLYDWHVKDSHHRWHGFTHPAKALNNARRDFQLSKVEENMIACHMFPLTLKLPAYKESWILYGADKICAVREIMNTIPKNMKRGRSE